MISVEDECGLRRCKMQLTPRKLIDLSTRGGRQENCPYLDTQPRMQRLRVGHPVRISQSSTRIGKIRRRGVWMWVEAFTRVRRDPRTLSITRIGEEEYICR